MSVFSHTAIVSFDLDGGMSLLGASNRAATGVSKLSEDYYDSKLSEDHYSESRENVCYFDVHSAALTTTFHSTNRFTNIDSIPLQAPRA